MNRGTPYFWNPPRGWSQRSRGFRFRFIQVHCIGMCCPSDSHRQAASQLLFKLPSCSSIDDLDTNTGWSTFQMKHLSRIDEAKTETCNRIIHPSATELRNLKKWGASCNTAPTGTLVETNRPSSAAMGVHVADSTRAKEETWLKYLP